MKKSKKRLGLLLMAAVIGLVQCSEDMDGGVGGNSDYRSVLTAGVSSVTVDAVDTATDDATVVDSTKVVFFTGAAGLQQLTSADFGVTGGGAVGSVSVAGDEVTVIVTFKANEKNRPKAYNVVIASTSEIVRGDASVRVIHKGLGGEGPFVLYVSENGDDVENDGLSAETPFKTLAYAYTAALNDYPGVDTITVLSDLGADEAMELSGAPANNAITITSDTTPPWTLTRSIGHDKSVVEVKNGAKVVFSNITINGNPTGDGSVYHRALFIDGAKVTLEADAHLVGKVTEDSYHGSYYDDGYLFGGGAVYVKSGTLTMEDGSTIEGKAIDTENNVFSGGGVYLDKNGTFTMNGGTVRGDAFYGGGVISYGAFTMNGGEISHSTSSISTRGGAGVYIATDGQFDMQGGTISYNEAVGDGGGVFVYRGTFEMSGSGTISDNDATGNGAGVYIDTGGKFDMSGSSSIRYNNALNGNGAGVYIAADGQFDMQGGAISDNDATGNGAGVYIDTGGKFDMQNGAISDNEATGNGGGVYVYSNGTFEMSGSSSSINDNNALNGGGVYNNGKFDMQDGAISGNKAAGNEAPSGNGGGVYNNAGTFTMNDGVISGNTAAGSTTNRADDHSDHGSAPDEDGNYGEGGGVFSNGNTFTMNNGIIYGFSSSEVNKSMRNKSASGLSTFAIFNPPWGIDRQSDNTETSVSP